MTHPLAALELTLWRTETRHDRALMEQNFAPDFREFGRSGRRYSRDDLLPSGESHDIDAILHDLSVTDLSATYALVTNTSELRRPADPEWANRAALRNRTRFPQGTPCEAPA